MRYTNKHNMAKLSRASKESLVYLAMGLVLAMAPVATMYIKASTHADLTFEWTEIIHVWMVYAIFLVPFLVHNYLIAPLLIYRHRKRIYFLSVLVLIVLFFAYQRWQRPQRPKPFGQHRMEIVDAVVGNKSGVWPKPRNPRPEDHPAGHVRPPFFFEQMDILNTIVLVLILGMNLGVKLYFKQERDRKTLLALERQNLEQQLEYLKFQINPHFFMNTLNNIHALVDIDPEQAKKSIVVLSRMMRYLLYDGNSRLIPLEKELLFIRHYIELMRMRYTDRVRITVSVPEQVPEAKLPPLVLFTFVENAFKHGITYKRDCFIDILVDATTDQLHLRLKNSKADKSNEEQGGVGLTNLIQRLDLIYKGRYTLTVDDEPDTYESNITIPLTHNP